MVNNFRTIRFLSFWQCFKNILPKSFCLLFVLLFFTGCSTPFSDKSDDVQAQYTSTLVSPPDFKITNAKYLSVSQQEYQSRTSHPEAERPAYSDRIHTSASTRDTGGCSPKDRFDNDGALAYNFRDRKSRLSLHMSLDGPKFSNPARLEFEEVMLRYRFTFNEPKTKKMRCLYPSRYQGLIGSVYNELYKREGKNAFDEAVDELEVRGLDVWR
jgi:hypothetical protein